MKKSNTVERINNRSNQCEKNFDAEMNDQEIQRESHFFIHRSEMRRFVHQANEI